LSIRIAARYERKDSVTLMGLGNALRNADAVIHLSPAFSGTENPGTSLKARRVSTRILLLDVLYLCSLCFHC